MLQPTYPETEMRGFVRASADGTDLGGDYILQIFVPHYSTFSQWSSNSSSSSRSSSVAATNLLLTDRHMIPSITLETINQIPIYI